MPSEDLPGAASSEVEEEEEEERFCTNLDSATSAESLPEKSKSSHCNNFVIQPTISKRIDISEPNKPNIRLTSESTNPFTMASKDLLATASSQVEEEEEKGFCTNSESTTSAESSPEKPKSSHGNRFMIQPTISKRIDRSEGNKLNVNANTAAATMLAPTKSSKKRPSNTFEIEKCSKKKKKVSDCADEKDIHSKGSVMLPSDEPGAIPRAWTENDEIVIFKGMIDYVKQGRDTYGDAIGFIDCIEESLSFEPNIEQLKTKMRRLKTRCDKIANRAKEDEDPVIEKPHDLRLYRLWKQIWGRKDGKYTGTVGIGTRSKKRGPGTNNIGVGLPQKSSFKLGEVSWSVFPCLNDMMGLDMDLKEQSGLIENLRAKGVGEKRKLQVSDVRAYLKWIDLVRGKQQQRQLKKKEKKKRQITMAELTELQMQSWSLYQWGSELWI